MAKSRPRRRKRKPPPLSRPEIRFCTLYVALDNATEAYLQAGFPDPRGRNRNCAGVMAWNLLRKREVRDYIWELREDAAESAKITVESLAAGFRRASRADIRLMLDADGLVLPLQELPDELALHVQGLEIEAVYEYEEIDGRRQRVEVGRKYKLRLENKTEARKILAQWKRMIGDRKDESAGKDAPPVVIVKGPRKVEPPTDSPSAPPTGGPTGG